MLRDEHRDDHPVTWRGTDRKPLPRSSGAGSRRAAERGQAVAELALVVPLLLFMLLGIADFARIYTTQISVESAAREAADYGALYPWHWEGDPADPGSNAEKTVQGMIDRACVAAKHLPEYVGPDDACTNPSFSYGIDTPVGVLVDDCYQVPRSDVPCKVTVTLAYDFDLIVPVDILGLPSTLSLERTSTFAISDFALDEPTP